VAAPSVRLGCSHVIHLHCLRERLRQRWAGRAVNFEFKHCPLCKASVTHAALAELLAPHDDGEKALRSRALERLHYDGLDKAFEVMNEAGSYYKRCASETTPIARACACMSALAPAAPRLGLAPRLCAGPSSLR